MQDPFTAKIVSRDARDFARKIKIKNQANKEEETMAITEKTLRQTRKDFDKHNEQVLKIYRRNGDKALLELLYLNSDKPEEVAEKVEEKVEEKVDEAKDAVEGAVDEAKDAVEGTVDDAKEAVEGAVDEAKDAVEGAVDDAKEAVEGAVDEAKDAVEGN